MSGFSGASELFDRRATSYDELDWVGDKRFLQSITTMCEPHGHDLLLDIATGTGAVLGSLVPAVRYGIGLDVSRRMLELSRKKLLHIPNVALVIAPAERIPFPRDSFDLITCRNGLHHLADPVVSLDEMRRVLKRRGRIVLAETVIPADAARDIWTVIVRAKDEGRHADFYHTRGEFEKYLTDQGFRVEKSSIHKQEVSTNNWLEKGLVPQDRRAWIRHRLLGAASQEKEAMGIETTNGDTTLIKQVAVLRIRPA